jgi:uncharacterized protein
MSTILWYPYASKCPNGCLYCFEDPSFKKESCVFNSFDKEKMAKSVRSLALGKENNSIILHGGEILNLPIDDLEFFFLESIKYVDRPTIQTSLGSPLTSEHVRVIKKYNCEIGISVDGPKELNILRGPRDPETNKKFQKTVYDNIRILKENDIKFGTLTILSKANASPDKIGDLINWCVNNTNGGRFNPIFVPQHEKNSEISKYALSSSELTNALSRLLSATIKYSNFEFKLFDEIKNALLGDPRAGCVFNRCDYLTTICQVVLPDGGISKCDRGFQDGYYYISEKEASVRWKMLEQTECKGCRYFVACTGGCPAEARDGDFRSKTVNCESYYFMFQCAENLLRKMFPGIFLVIDLHNYYEDYCLTGKRFNFLARDAYFIDTRERMVNSFKLLGWTPESETIPDTERKTGFSHMDSNVSLDRDPKKSCTCGDKNCSKQ